jgi:hypothetical protein
MSKMHGHINITFVYVIMLVLLNVITESLRVFGSGPYTSDTTGNVMRVSILTEEVKRPSHLANPNY